MAPRGVACPCVAHTLADVERRLDVAAVAVSVSVAPVRVVAGDVDGLEGVVDLSAVKVVHPG